MESVSKALDWTRAATDKRQQIHGSLAFDGSYKNKAPTLLSPKDKNTVLEFARKTLMARGINAYAMDAVECARALKSVSLQEPEAWELLLRYQHRSLENALKGRIRHGRPRTGR